MNQTLCLLCLKLYLLASIAHLFHSIGVILGYKVEQMLGLFNCLPSKPKKPGFSLQNSLPIIPRTSDGIPQGKVLGAHDNLANVTVM